jgi:hypothetical protein
MADLALNPLPLEDPKGGAKSLTRVSGIGAAIVAVLTAVDGTWDTIFDTDTPTWAKPVFMMVVVGAWAVIASADLLGRGYVKGHELAAEAAKEGGKTTAEAQKEVAKATAEAKKDVAKGAIRVITLPGLSAIDKRDQDQSAVVTAARVSASAPDDPTFLVMREDGSTRWAAASDLKFN